ncbi:hypothetical protein L6303_05430 [archaeon]|nr:hypothetical protein [Nanoarchaeota archaeon]MCG2724160.1 hypothetical protein [archaeon]
MTKANIETKDGTKIVIEGTPEEISKVMNLYKDEKTPETPAKEFKKFIKAKANSKPTITDTIRKILAEGFFNKPKSLAELKQGLEEQGTFIPITTLSAIVLGLVKGKELRRIKQEKKWVYVRR